MATGKYGDEAEQLLHRQGKFGDVRLRGRGIRLVTPNRISRDSASGRLVIANAKSVAMFAWSLRTASPFIGRNIRRCIGAGEIEAIWGGTSCDLFLRDIGRGGRYFSRSFAVAGRVAAGPWGVKEGGIRGRRRRRKSHGEKHELFAADVLAMRRGGGRALFVFRNGSRMSTRRNSGTPRSCV